MSEKVIALENTTPCEFMSGYKNIFVQILIFKERKIDQYVLYERAPTPHWKRGVVDWKEIQMTWTIEEPTRYAQLLAGETHLTEVN